MFKKTVCLCAQTGRPAQPLRPNHVHSALHRHHRRQAIPRQRRRLCERGRQEGDRLRERGAAAGQRRDASQQQHARLQARRGAAGVHEEQKLPVRQLVAKVGRADDRGAGDAGQRSRRERRARQCITAVAQQLARARVVFFKKLFACVPESMDPRRRWSRLTRWTTSS